MSGARPRGLPIAWQVLALLGLSLIAAQLINIYIIANLPLPAGAMTSPREIAAHVRQTVSAVRAAPPEARAAVAEKAETHQIRYFVTDRLLPPRPDGGLTSEMSFAIAPQLGMRPEDVRVVLRMSRAPLRAPLNEPGSGPPATFNPERAGQMMARALILVRVEGETWLGARLKQRPEERLWLSHVGLWFVATALFLAPFALWFAHRMAAPIGRFAGAAERLGRDPRAAPLAEEGPRELRAAMRAFNLMQERIRRFVSDRTLMLAAVSHDLRTPLQRLRFRIDSLPEDQRAALLNDVEEMEAMLASTLAFARDDAHAAPRQPLDLGALVQSVCDDASDAGGAATAETGGGRIVITADPIGLKRAIANLVANALKYAGAAEARITREGGMAIIEIADRGPGIPENLLDEVFQPFRRLEPSRSRATGGVGLGLAIARTIARGHGGDVNLLNRPGGGLIARLSLPA